MQHKHKPDKYIPALLFLSVLLLAIYSFFRILSIREEAEGRQYYADIYSEGKQLDSIPLWQVSESYTLQIVSENGGTNDGHNRILVEPGAISVLSADCPDQICVHQGILSDSALPIVCLPNRLVIQLREADDGDSLLDGVTH